MASCTSQCNPGKVTFPLQILCTVMVLFTKHSEGTALIMKKHYPKAKIPEGDSPQLLTGCVTQGKSLKFSAPCFPICTVRLGWEDAVLVEHVATDTLFSSVLVARTLVQSKRDPLTRLSLSASLTSGPSRLRRTQRTTLGICTCWPHTGTVPSWLCDPGCVASPL